VYEVSIEAQLHSTGIYKMFDTRSQF